MIKNIQYLRFLAAALVVFAHSNLQIYGVGPQLTNLGGFGVDIFFVVSGFIMPYIIFGGLYREGVSAKMGAAGFLWRRITRIWPMYFLTIVMVLFISYLVSTGAIPNVTADLAYIFNGSKIEPAWIFQTLTFSHWDRPPILGIGWTLQVEFLFYAAIAFALAASAKTLEGIEAILIAFFFTALIMSPSSPIASAFSNAMVIEFLLGFFLYRTVSRGLLIQKHIAMILVVITIPAVLLIEHTGAIKLQGNLYRPIAWGVPAFFLTWAALSLESYTPKIPTLELLGDASYSLYLTHGFVSPVFVYLLVSTGIASALSWWFYLPLYLIVCQLIGLAAHLYIEKPLNRYIRNLVRVEKKCATA